MKDGNVMATETVGKFTSLLDKILGNKKLAPEECDELVDTLKEIAEDSERPGDERNAASLLRASLAARRARGEY